MGDSLTRKIIRSHMVKGSMTPGEDVFVRVDQTLTHDINAVMTYLGFEQLGIPTQVKTSVSYLDHNLLYIDFKTPDDHNYLRTIAEKTGVHVSRPGNGICHMVQTSRFAVPGELLMGGDSHTPSGGAVGMLSIGVGGMDITTAMAGIPMRLTMPKVVKVNLSGRLRAGVNAKEVVLEMLRRVTIKGGLGKVFEYVGEGAKTLTVPERLTITNMGAEMGATTSIFPADEVVRGFMEAQDRGDQYIELLPDADAEYDEEMDLDLSALEPLIALPHQPDNVVPMRTLQEHPVVQQVFMGSCTNGSYSDFAKAALVMQGRHVSENLQCTAGIASKQIYKQLLKDGYLDMLVDAGVRILELSCGPCCAIGQVPPTNGVAVRTSNRNFRGRAGSPNANVYLVSPETAAATAIKGTFATAEEIMGADVEKLSAVQEPMHYMVDDAMIIPPLPKEEREKVEVLKGPNIAFLPVPKKPEKNLRVRVSLKAVDNISTDDITPAGAEFSSMRSNIPLMSQYCYHRYDPQFAERARQLGESIIVGGENYGQGSSREHAAINPMYLGVKAVIAKSIARIHKGNLINHGVVPMLFENPVDYDRVQQIDELVIEDFIGQIPTKHVLVKDVTQNFTFRCRLELSEAETSVVLAGGQLRYLKQQLVEMGVLQPEALEE